MIVTVGSIAAGIVWRQSTFSGRTMMTLVSKCRYRKKHGENCIHHIHVGRIEVPMSV